MNSDASDPKTGAGEAVREAQPPTLTKDELLLIATCLTDWADERRKDQDDPSDVPELDRLSLKTAKLAYRVGSAPPPSEPAPLTWQPIETAPRPERGRRKVIDVWCVTDDHESAQFYFGNTMSGVKDRQMWQGRVSEVYWLDGAWRPATGLRLHGLTVTPTHWMPLPSAPTDGDLTPSKATS